MEPGEIRDDDDVLEITTATDENFLSQDEESVSCASASTSKRKNVDEKHVEDSRSKRMKRKASVAEKSRSYHNREGKNRRKKYLKGGFEYPEVLKTSPGTTRTNEGNMNRDYNQSLDVYRKRDRYVFKPTSSPHETVNTSIVFVSNDQGYVLTNGIRWHSNEVIYEANWIYDVFQAICFLTDGRCSDFSRLEEKGSYKIIFYVPDEKSWARIADFVDRFKENLTCSISIRKVEDDYSLDYIDRMGKAKSLLNNFHKRA